MQQSYIDSCTVSAATHAPPTRHVWQQSREHFVTYTGSSCSCIGVAMKRPTTYHYRSADPGRRLHSPGAQGVSHTHWIYRTLHRNLWHCSQGVTSAQAAGLSERVILLSSIVAGFNATLVYRLKCWIHVHKQSKPDKERHTNHRSSQAMIMKRARSSVYAQLKNPSGKTTAG